MLYMEGDDRENIQTDGEDRTGRERENQRIGDTNEMRKERIREKCTVDLRDWLRIFCRQDDAKVRQYLHWSFPDKLQMMLQWSGSDGLVRSSTV